jgi:hypothetical protein
VVVPSPKLTFQKNELWRANKRLRETKRQEGKAVG